MNLYRLYETGADYGVLVVADTGREAKCLSFPVLRGFNPDAEYIHLRVKLLEKDVPHTRGVRDGSQVEDWENEYWCIREFEECHCRHCRTLREDGTYYVDF